MKKLFSLLFASLLILVCLSGCGSVTPDPEKLNVVCTIFPQYDIVRQIAGDSVELTMLLPYGMESHDFKLENLSIKDLALVSEADVFISVGGSSDSEWVEKLKDEVGNPHCTWLEMSELTEVLCVEEHSHDHGQEQHHEHDEDFDEHIWTSPRRMSEAAEKIAEVLKRKDESIITACTENLEKFQAELMQLDSEFEILGQKATKPAIFADRFSFRYLFYDYGLEYEAAFTGCSSSVDPSALQIAELTEKALAVDAKVVLYMENSNVKYAQKIADSADASVKMLHSCHNLSRQEFQRGETYISLMKNNLEYLKGAVR